jgi:LuxR family transcriptional regulator, maltose regulon positive regulatory protein
VDALAQALTLGCPQGYARVFADEGPPMSALLTRLVAARKAERAAARGVPLGCLAQLLRAFGGIDAAPGVLVEQLSARELEVLALLATGKANRAIADELVITLDTVKRHVTHILDKLGVPNRTAAVTRARELGLLR